MWFNILTSTLVTHGPPHPAKVCSIHTTLSFKCAVPFNKCVISYDSGLKTSGNYRVTFHLTAEGKGTFLSTTPFLLCGIY